MDGGMKTLRDKQSRVELRERLAKLMPDSRSGWGRMTAHQAVCHLNDSFRVGLGEKPVSPGDTLVYRTIESG